MNLEDKLQEMRKITVGNLPKQYLDELRIYNNQITHTETSLTEKRKALMDFNMLRAELTEKGHYVDYLNYMSVEYKHKLYPGDKNGQY